jgi:hypothetical protein
MKFTGGGLRPADVVDPARRGEQVRRAHATLQTVNEAITVTAGTGRATVLFVSNGFDSSPERSPELDIALANVLDTAKRVNAVFHVFNVRALVGNLDPQLLTIDPDRWSAHLRATSESLQRLADATGGRMVSTLGNVDAVLEQIAAAARQQKSKAEPPAMSIPRFRD